MKRSKVYPGLMSILDGISFLMQEQLRKFLVEHPYAGPTLTMMRIDLYAGRTTPPLPPEVVIDLIE